MGFSHSDSPFFRLVRENRFKTMSVFGGDSWAREAQHRKRRVDDLMIQGIDASVYRKLPGGKFLCLICSRRPVLDTPLTLSAHLKGSSHRVAEARLKERELSKENEIKKRLAMADSSGTRTSGSTDHRQRCAQKKREIPDVRSNTCNPKGSSTEVVKPQEETVEHQLECRDRRERELKFTAAGWKRDGFGKWYKDENVEFDSDEEDPNVCL